MCHPGAQLFFSSVNAVNCFTTAVRNVQSLLYTSPTKSTTHIPSTRSVTFILRDMDGVAYTTGSDLDNDHKEIHFSLRYIAGIPKERARAEIWGVVTHELVHCFQWSPHNVPGGLIEGIADWVRLRCDWIPPHWNKEFDGEWDGGYQKTGYFLEYLEGRFGEGTVQKINETLRVVHRYDTEKFWHKALGKEVKQLWKDYAESNKDK